MRRREFLALAGGALASSLETRAGEGERRVGVLMSVADDAEGRARFSAFRDKLEELGWVEGGNDFSQAFQHHRRFGQDCSESKPHLQPNWRA